MHKRFPTFYTNSLYLHVIQSECRDVYCPFQVALSLYSDPNTIGKPSFSLFGNNVTVTLNNFLTEALYLLKKQLFQQALFLFLDFYQKL